MDLGIYPTPLQTCDLGAAAPLLVKREDLSGVGFGGNKVRKLRALIDDARDQGATTLLTWGGPQSNHCALTAVAARNAGLDVEVFFTGHAEAGRGNQRVHDLLDVPRHEGFTGEADVDHRDDEGESGGSHPAPTPA